MISTFQEGPARPRKPVRCADVVLLLLVAALSFACSGSSERSRANAECEMRPVRMAVASSLREIADGIADDLADDRVKDLAKGIEADHSAPAIETSYGASSALARQLRHGAPIDVLVVADGELADSLSNEGLIEGHTQVDVARGRLVLVARADHDWGESGLSALDASAARRVALPVRAVPLGRYAHAWLEDRQRLGDLEGRIVHTEDARSTLSAVDQGHVDLAFVYASDARLGTRIRVLADLDSAGHPPIRYVAARTTGASDCPQVDRVLSAWSEGSTRARLREAGFEGIAGARSESASVSGPAAEGRE